MREWLSAVRDGIHYEVTWDNDLKSGVRVAVERIANTFAYPAAKAVGAAGLPQFKHARAEWPRAHAAC